MTTHAGYDDGFLGIDVSLPAPIEGAPRRLDYPRFSVLLDTGRKLAAVTAVNIDGATLLDLPRTGQWRLDPRAGDDEQTGPEVYARNDFDRGHLVRRRDPGWGDPEEARRATEATFFYPNAAPQASVFNQSKDLWLGLEDHVLAYADATAQRISVFTAPVLASDDPEYRGIRVPRRFFKIAAWVSETTGTRLAATGFILDQSDLIDTRDGAAIVVPLSAFRTFQVPVDEIGSITGLDLGPLPDADILEDRRLRGEDAWRLLRTADDIVL